MNAPCIAQMNASEAAAVSACSEVIPKFERSVCEPYSDFSWEIDISESCDAEIRENPEQAEYQAISALRSFLNYKGSEALTLSLAAEEKNDKLAKFVLGLIYSEGSVADVEWNEDRAIRYFSESAEQGFALSQMALYWALTRSDDIPQDNEAQRWLESAVALDLPAAKIEFAKRKLSQQGNTASIETGVRLLIEAYSDLDEKGLETDCQFVLDESLNEDERTHSDQLIVLDALANLMDNPGYRPSVLVALLSSDSGTCQAL